MVSYRSNSFFDNVSISQETLDVIYHSFTQNCPKIALILKNLEGNFIDEIDVFEDLIIEACFESRMSALTELCREFSPEIQDNFVKR